MFKNKGLVVAIAVVILALLGGVAYMKFAKSSTAPQQTTVQEQSKASPSSRVENLKSLLAGGKTVNCTINNPGNGETGTVFISDKKFRGDFVTKDSNGKIVDSHVISDGTYTYIWTSESPGGIKMKVDITSAEASAQAKNFNLGEQTGLNCSPWGVDASKFTVPTNIQFTDLSSMIAPKATSGTTKTQTASPCDQIADPTGKAACLKALNGGQ